MFGHNVSCQNSNLIKFHIIWHNQSITFPIMGHKPPSTVKKVRHARARLNFFLVQLVLVFHNKVLPIPWKIKFTIGNIALRLSIATESSASVAVTQCSTFINGIVFAAVSCGDYKLRPSLIPTPCLRARNVVRCKSRFTSRFKWCT